jgi:hypothetical protein
MNVERFLYGELGLSIVDENKLRSLTSRFMSANRKDIFSVHIWLWFGLGAFFVATAFSAYPRLMALPAIGTVTLIVIMVNDFRNARYRFETALTPLTVERLPQMLLDMLQEEKGRDLGLNDVVEDLMRQQDGKLYGHQLLGLYDERRQRQVKKLKSAIGVKSYPTTTGSQS